MAVPNRGNKESLTLGGGSVTENETLFYYAPERGWDRGTFRGFGKQAKIAHKSGNHSGTKDPPNNANGREILVRNKEGENYQLAPRDVYIPLADTLGGHAPNDLLALPELHHSVLVHSMRERHSRDVCYTFLGSLLCYMNPFQFNIPHYAMSKIDEYLSKAPHPNVHDTAHGGDQLLPHPWSVAHRVFFEMRESRKNHSIIISGESGSGKTEACKIVLHYLCCLSADLIGVERPPHPQQAQAQMMMAKSSSSSSPPSSSSASSSSPPKSSSAGGPGQAPTLQPSPSFTLSASESASMDKSLISQLIDKVNASNPIMEAFGNAKTSRNDNSSRFGKLLEVQFSSVGEIGGMKISPFLLEKSRCVTAAAEERVYHSFYQLMAGASDALKNELKLKNARDFPMLSRGGSIQVNGMNDAKEFEVTCEAFLKMGFHKDERDFVWRIVAACLHLSTVSFVAKPEPEPERLATPASPTSSRARAAAAPGTGAAKAAAAMFESKSTPPSAFSSSSTRGHNSSSSSNVVSSSPITRGAPAGASPKEDPASQQLAAISPASAPLVEFIAEKLLKVDSKDFSEMLTTRIMAVGRDLMPKPLTILEAYRQRDTLQKHIYSCLFYWIIEKINESTSSVAGESFVAANTISVLDIFGFEDFATGNSLEQLCINLANEALQRHYSYHVFVRDTEEISSEGVDAQMAPFCDNKPCVDLIMGKMGSLFSILEDKTKSDLDSGRVDPNMKYLEEITQKFRPDYHTSKPEGKSVMERDPSELTQPSDFFARSKMDKAGFAVKHFASNVRYNVDLFVEKNIDALKDNVKTVLFSSMDPLFQGLMEVGEMQDGGGGGDGPGSPVAFSPRGARGGFPSSSSSGAPPSSPLMGMGGKPGGKMGIVGQFRKSLQELLNTLDNTQPNWIRCIRPDPKKAPKLFHTKSVLEQLMATGVLETITQRQRNFPFRLEIPNFVHRFAAICAGTNAFKRIGRSGGLHEKCAAILSSASTTNRQHAQVGRTKVFLRSEGLNKLERVRQERVTILSSQVGVFSLAYTSRHIRRQLEVAAAQRRIRRWYLRWSWFRKMMRALIAYLKKKTMELHERHRQALMETETKERALMGTLERTDRRPHLGRHMAELVPLLRAATDHLVKVEPSFRDRVSKLEFQERAHRLVQAELVGRKAAALATQQREELERRAFEIATEKLALEVNEARKEIRGEEKAERAELDVYWQPVHRALVKLAERIKLFARHRDSMVEKLKEDYELERERIKDAEERRIASEARLWQTLNGTAATKRDMEQLLGMGLTPDQAQEQMRRFFLSGAPSKMLASGQLRNKDRHAAASVVPVSHGSDADRVTHQKYADLLREQFEQSVKSGRTKMLPDHSKLDVAREAIHQQQLNQQQQRASAAARSGSSSSFSSVIAAAPSYLESAKVSDKTKIYATFVRAMKDGLVPEGTTFAEYMELEQRLREKALQRQDSSQERDYDDDDDDGDHAGQQLPSRRFADPNAAPGSMRQQQQQDSPPRRSVSFNKHASASAGFVCRRV